jgi:hypothetical protein
MEKKTRRRLQLSDRVAALDARIARTVSVLDALHKRRAALLDAARAEAARREEEIAAIERGHE